MDRALEILKSARGSPLVWSQQRGFSHDYTLTGGDRTLATLRWPKTFGSLAEGRIGDATWTFKRVGFWRPAVTIRRPETGDHDVGRLVMDWRRGDLVLPGGVSFRWDLVSFWKSEWAFFDASGKDRLVEFVPETRFFKMSMGVAIHRAAEERAELPLLLLLGWYLLVMASQDDAAAATFIVG
jgi:hypothetical protein